MFSEKFILGPPGGRPGIVVWVGRLIAVERLLRGLILLTVGFLFLAVGPATGDSFLWELYRKGVRIANLDLHRTVLHPLVADVTGSRFELLTSAVAFGVGAIVLIEGLGLAFGKRWAWWLTLVGSVGFSIAGIEAVRLEPTPWRIWGLAGNVLLALWFAWRILADAMRGAPSAPEVAAQPKEPVRSFRV